MDEKLMPKSSNHVRSLLCGCTKTRQKITVWLFGEQINRNKRRFYLSLGYVLVAFNLN